MYTLPSLYLTVDLFRTPEMLQNSMHAALYDLTIRADDLEFLNACQLWSQTILLGSMDGYRDRFEHTASSFRNRIDEAKEKSSVMVKMITEKYLERLSSGAIQSPLSSPQIRQHE
jgi:prephenate dehydrogenase (NADP+)